MMDTRKLDLDCQEFSPGEWRVFCLNSRLELSNKQKSAEHAWAVAAQRLADCISGIRRSVCDVED
jgi:hypothetical protein